MNATLNQITKLNPALCPQACAEIMLRCKHAENDTVIFKGLIYEITVGGEIWNVGTNAPFKNSWTDTDFEF